MEDYFFFLTLALALTFFFAAMFVPPLIHQNDRIIITN